MYPISNAAKKMLHVSAINRKITWYGTMTTENGKEYEISTDIVMKNTGTIKHESELPFVGGAYSAEFRAQLILQDVDPETLKNAAIKLDVTIEHPPVPEDGATWGTMRIGTWNTVSQMTWGQIAGGVKTDIPMGVFYIADAKRAMNSIKITAYDSMTKFDVDLPGMDSTSRSVYGWLKWACDACGVTLGMTKSQIKAMPNGSRSLVYAVIDSKVKTYRDLIGYLAAVLGSVAMIDRFDQLILKTVNAESVATLTPDDRFSSEYEDTKRKYTGLSLEYKAKAVREYYKNTDAMADTGLVVDLEENPFLQISNDSARNAAVQKIIDSLSGITFNPFSASIPSHPEFDLLDTITFTDGHAPADCQSIITSLTRTINGGVSIRCETPKEMKEQERKNVQTSGTSSSRVSGGDMWIKVCSAPEEITEMVPGLEYPTTELTINCPTDNTTMQIAWTGCYSLGEDATVTVRVLVDDKEIYSASDDQKAGKHTMNVTTGHSVSSKGEYVISIMVKEVPA